MKDPVRHSEPGPIPGGLRRLEEGRKARRYLYPATVLYTVYPLALLALVLRSRHAVVGVLCFLAGVALWTPLEYVAHRYVLHGRFPASRNLFHQLLHVMFDSTHVEHHQKPWSAEHLSGSFKTTVPVILALNLPGLLIPWYVWPLLIAGVVQSFIVEEWVHYSVHFSRRGGRYFEYIRRHHMYHHSAIGSEVAFGLTNGIWDVVWHTRIPERHRRKVHGGRARRAKHHGRAALLTGSTRSTQASS
ncbi:MAG TPA: sterol desaturase family protein [Gemmatimonadaceae bacterium]|nr:sterol desaturase family protein [Gemmatimonadaceae bacterium]